MQTLRLLTALLAIAGLTACDGDIGVDAGPMTDSGPRRLCPTDGVPNADELMGPCCWRDDQSTQHDAPELRLNYLEITEPTGSPLASATLRTVLNRSMQDESFNWLMRFEGADADGAVNVLTGFGRRNMDGTYNFSDGTGMDMPSWCPAQIPGALTGERVTSDEIPGTLTIPVFNDAGTMLQVELALRSLSIVEANWTEGRACIGAKSNRPLLYTTGATLSAYIEVEGSRTQMIDVPPVVTTVCAAIAGALDLASYCEDNAQGDWTIPPDSLCDAAGCTQNADGMTDVCDPATTCNAWHLVAGFAAAGVDIANGACM